MSTDVDIRDLRRRKGWSQQQLAEFLGVDRSTVSRLENGQPPQGPVSRLLAILAEGEEAA